MKVFIKPNLDKPDARSCAADVSSMLLKIASRRDEPLEVLFEEEARGYIEAHESVVFTETTSALQACDIVVPVGGDGTIMRAAEAAARFGKPILGVNAGRIGFLTQMESHELKELERLFTGSYKLLDRMMLEAKIENGGEAQEFIALNDVVVRHGDSDRIVEIEVRQGAGLVASHRADGVIFSTPTGSTAYSMSAGGPIVSPELSLILMTAICPHSPFNCPLVLSPEQAYTVREKLLGGRNGMYVSVDGVRVDKLKPDGAVTISRSKTVAKFIDLGLREFFSNLNQKLSWRRSQ